MSKKLDNISKLNLNTFEIEQLNKKHQAEINNVVLLNDSKEVIIHYKPKKLTLNNAYDILMNSIEKLN